MGVQGGPVGDRQSAGEHQLHDGAVLVGHQVEVHIQVCDVAVVVELRTQRGEPPPADPAGIDVDPAGVVDVDHQHTTGVRFDVVIVGDLGRTGIPDAAAVAHPGAGVPVPQGHIVHGAAVQGVAQRRQPDGGRPGGIGVEGVDRAVRDQHADGAVGRQIRERLGGQVGGGSLRSPRRRHDLQPGPDVVPAGPVQHGDVGRALGHEQGAGEHRRRVEGIVVAGQQIHRNVDGAHDFQRLTDDTWVELVVLEHVAGDHDELRPRLRRDRTQAGDRVAPGGGVARRASPCRKWRVMPSCQSAVWMNRIRVPLFATAVSWSRASLWRGADKFGDAARHVAIRCIGGARSERSCASECGNGSRMSGEREVSAVAPASAGTDRASAGRDDQRVLVLMRHAKSDYPIGVSDHDRPLAPRGEREAGLASATGCGRGRRGHRAVHRISAVLHRHPDPPDPGARTGIDAPTEFLDRIYGATPGAIIDEINRVDANVRSLLVLGHEPAMSQLALGLAGVDGSNPAAIERIMMKYPTSAMAVLRMRGPWHAGTRRRDAHDVPRPGKSARVHRSSRQRGESRTDAHTRRK